TKLLTALLEAKPVFYPVPEVEETEDPRPPKAKAPAKRKAPAAKQEASEVPTSDDAKTYTLEEVRAIAHEISTSGAGGIGVVKAALQECGVKNLTALDPDQYPQFVNRIQDVG